MRTAFTSTLTCILLLTACKREFDIPPVKPFKEGVRISISAIKARFDPVNTYRFKGDTSLSCVVIADEASGNLFKEVYVRDGSGAIRVKLTASGALFVGDSIRIYLNNAVLSQYGDLVHLDSVNVATNVVKLASGLNPAPREISLDQTGDPSLESQLVKINNVEFLEAGRNQPFANAAAKAAVQHTLQDCSGRKIILRTSGYAYFADQRTPSGNGSITGILGRYNTTLQLLLRKPEELAMTGTLCPAVNPTVTAGPGILLSKDFNDFNVISGGWSTYNVSGSIHWSASTKGGAPNAYAMISNYVSSVNLPCETWLISPPLDLAASNNPMLTFRNACNYTGPVLELLVSTNYTGGLPSSASWTALPFSASTGGFTFVSSGAILLSNFKSGATRFAFKYTGTASAGSTWELDDILVKQD